MGQDLLTHGGKEGKSRIETLLFGPFMPKKKFSRSRCHIFDAASVVDHSVAFVWNFEAEI